MKKHKLNPNPASGLDRTAPKPISDTPPGRDNPFVNASLEDTSYHAYRLSNGGKLSFCRDRSDHVGFLKIVVEDCDLVLPAKLSTPWTGWNDASRNAFQWLDEMGIQYRVIDKVEAEYEELRRYANGPRW